MTEREVNKILQGDCLEEMKKLPDNSVDSIITDPPYGLEFMGKHWDKFGKGQNIAGGTTGKDTPFGRSKPLTSYYQYGLSEKRDMQNFFFGWAIECLRVLKPGGFLLAMGGTRTYHRLVCGIEDAGFEIRDTIMWLYGSGFPKSLNIGKQIDKMEGVNHPKNIPISENNSMSGANYTRNKMEIKSELGKEWEGWGTALKPACEPIVVARKPLSEKNVALNVLKWGTGGINIDACRIGFEKGDSIIAKNPHTKSKGTDAYDVNCYGKYKPTETPIDYTKSQGRFPANIILDEEAGNILDEQSGISKSEAIKSPFKNQNITYRKLEEGGNIPKGFNDKGGASRFFYCAKASKSERNFGCEDLEEQKQDASRKEGNVGGDNPRNRGVHLRKNNHPTVKPIKLMEYLIKLVSKEGATVLDPFLGSGTTGIACAKLNRNFIGIEKEEEYIKIAKARIKPFLEQEKLR